jgi:hypothetical protein
LQVASSSYLLILVKNNKSKLINRELTGYKM